MKSAINFLLSIVAFSPLYVLADISISETADRAGRIVISGNITPSDYSALLEKHRTLKLEKRDTSFIFLDSLGGDVETAIRIGRYVRKEGFHAIVHKGKICASSCVLVLAGCSKRHV